MLIKIIYKYKLYPKYQESMIENLHVLTDMAIEILFANMEIEYVSKVFLIQIFKN